jgi:flagellar biosynthetic protein FliQ
MTEGDAATALRDTLMLVVKLGGPPLLAALAVGLIVSVVQAVTSINESTLGFLPKVVAVGGALVLLGPWMSAQLGDFTRTLMDRLIAIGGM